MPRTKVSKNTKRNRDAANREEKIRLYETNMDAFLNKFDRTEMDHVIEIEREFNMRLARISTKELQRKMSEFKELNISRFDDLNNLAPTDSSNCTNGSLLFNSTQASLQRSTKLLNPNDEGYLTEDSSTGPGATLAAFTSSASASSSASISSTLLRNQAQQRVLRTPGGPMASARLRRPRRSRSACGDIVPGSACKSQLSAQRTATEQHNSRSKLRTPVAARGKAFSADRTPKVRNDRSCSPQSPPAAILRWPKPGETVLSKCGTPVVAQVMPDKYANVNIPVRNGVISLQPKKLSQLNKDIIDSIDADTMNQIKTLHANLNLIMSMADKTANK